MKLSLSIPLLLSVASTCLAATMGSIRSGKAISGLIENSRRLDQAEEDYAFLQNYELKFVACKGGQLTQNENGQYVDTAKVVVYRLCPSDGSCDSDCSGGYGEYVVSLNTYVEAYFEDQRENQENQEEEENFRLEEYLACGEYEVEEQEGEEGEGENEQEGENQEENEVAYYIGPTCTDDGTDIKLELFTDDACSSVSNDVAFNDLSGMDLPYSSGGLVSTSCSSCTENDNDGDGVSELCEGLYELSYGCETNMETYSANGKDESHCEYISELTNSKSKSSSSGSSGRGAGWAIFWVIFVVAIVGVAGFIFYRRKGKSQLCLFCYYRSLSNLLPGRRFVNTAKAAEGSGSDYQDGLMEEKSGGFFSKFRLTGNK
jgi:hypothetical protein